MRIEFERSGGLAGLVQRCCLDTETLAPPARHTPPDCSQQPPPAAARARSAGAVM
ncbi:MAG TPA: hypothetical protein VKP64_06335 [Mycobacteriales bacterium]|nr:hypothetical protein [Mycobacteriales bacterium]